jgi:hypothetical protein
VDIVKAALSEDRAGCTDKDTETQAT